jgi:ribosomal protein S18 acetylase RimI-like enzyme
MMTVRQASLSDADEIARLTGELGYGDDSSAIRGRLQRILLRSDHIVFVAVATGKVAGWLQAQVTESLESGHRVEIMGLIVGGGHRRLGIGRALVGHAERWARGLGLHVLVVRSNVTRLESHDFYPAIGFNVAKTQAVYRKHLKE